MTRILIGSRRVAPDDGGKPGKWEDREWCWVADERYASPKVGTPQRTNYIDTSKVANCWEIISFRWFVEEKP